MSGTGLCRCGCGKATPIATQTRSNLGHVKGQPTPYCRGHAGHRGASPDAAERKRIERENQPGPNPSGLCMCGCGERAPIASRSTTRNGNVHGKPVRYIVGHSSRKPGPDYIVDPVTGCHLWQRGKDDHGYGITSVDGKVRRAHVVAYEVKYGPVPIGKELDHTCRNRPCCNPDHVEPVRHRVNVWRGLLAKTTIERAREIRELAASPGGLSPLALADIYSITRDSVYAILNHRTWREEEMAA